MSIDNTICVLRTRKPNGLGSEFRVALVQAAERFYPGEMKRKNYWMLVQSFGRSRVFADKDESRDEEFCPSAEEQAWKQALRKARGLRRSGRGGLEYGVRSVHLKMVFPADAKPPRHRRRT